MNLITISYQFRKHKLGRQTQSSTRFGAGSYDKAEYGSEIVFLFSISINRLLKSFVRFIVQRSEIRKKQHDFKRVHFECRMVLFTRYERKVDFFSIVYKKGEIF